MNYQPDHLQDDIEGLCYYIKELKTLCETEETALNVDCEHLYQFDSALYSQLIHFPSEIIPYFDSMANHLFKEVNHDANATHTIQVRPMNLRAT